MNCLCKNIYKFSKKYQKPIYILILQNVGYPLILNGIDKTTQMCYNITEHYPNGVRGNSLPRRSSDNEMWCNGNTTDFDSVIVGSSPAVSGGIVS